MTVAVCPLHQPFLPSHWLLAAVCGAWLSMLMPLTVALALLSALSVAVPLALWFTPSSLRTMSLAHSWTPERMSLQVNRTRTALLNQPAALALRGVPSLLTVAP